MKNTIRIRGTLYYKNYQEVFLDNFFKLIPEATLQAKDIMFDEVTQSWIEVDGLIGRKVKSISEWLVPYRPIKDVSFKTYQLRVGSEVMPNVMDWKFRTKNDVEYTPRTTYNGMSHPYISCTTEEAEQLIPSGIYCSGCPFHDLLSEFPHQENGWCHYLKDGDMVGDVSGLLWDGCKECNKNMEME